MKKFLTLVLISILFACENEIATPTLEGQWQLFEVLADPGDGSGTFKPVESDHQIKLFSNLSFLSTASLCNQPGSNPGSVGTGTYDTTRMVIIPDNCLFDDQQIEYNFEIDSHGHLIIYFPCIEPCASKYRKIGVISSTE